MQYSLKKISSLYRPFLFCLGGFLMALFVFFYSQDRYEKHVFSALASYITRDLNEDSPAYKDSVVVRSLQLVHFLEEGRGKIFRNVTATDFQSSLLNPVVDDLITGKGACGSYSLVLARLLKELGFSIRLGQMKVGSEYGGHIILEVKRSQGWIVLDPLYNLYFTKPDGGLASFKDISSDWPNYSRQVPQGYNAAYNYQDIRYTNWNKIPVLMPVVQKLLNLIIGKESTDHLSLRVILLEKYFIFSIVTLIVLLLLFFYLGLGYVRQRITRIRIASEQQPSLDVMQNVA